jgi:hypothetical protein
LGSFSREMILQSLSTSLQDSIRFLHLPIPAIYRLSLRIAFLPFLRKEDRQAYQVASY